MVNFKTKLSVQMKTFRYHRYLRYLFSAALVVWCGVVWCVVVLCGVVVFSFIVKFGCFYKDIISYPAASVTSVVISEQLNACVRWDKIVGQCWIHA